MQKLTSIQILKENEEYISGEEFLKRGQEITKGTMDKKAFEFYAKEENWHLLPTDCNYLYFVDTEFRDSDGSRSVRSLYRNDSKWYRYYGWIDSRFHRHCRVAVLASSPQNSDPKLSLDTQSFDLPHELTINGVVYIKK